MDESDTSRTRLKPMLKYYAVFAFMIALGEGLVIASELPDAIMYTGIGFIVIGIVGIFTWSPTPDGW